jgi:soluble lytic murein transglycosylase-like protein
MADITALARRAARQAGVPEDLYAALIVHGERSYQGWQRSPVGAYGPAQLMPDTARSLEQRYHVNTRTRYGNLLGGAYYLKEQLHTFGGDRRKAVAAYNAGPGNVQKYGGVPPFQETRDYVQNVFGGIEHSHGISRVQSAHPPLSRARSKPRSVRLPARC